MDGRLPDIPVTVRRFMPSDQPACQTLYHDGVLAGGHLAENDTGYDIDDIAAAYMARPGNCFFVALDAGGEVVGTVGVHHHGDEVGTGEIRRLRVRPDRQRRGIGSQLLEAALQFCQDQGDLKVTLDSHMDLEPALQLFQKFRFRHQRSRTVGDKEMLFFYLDLYAGEAREE